MFGSRRLKAAWTIQVVIVIGIQGINPKPQMIPTSDYINCTTIKSVALDSQPNQRIENFSPYAVTNEANEENTQSPVYEILTAGTLESTSRVIVPIAAYQFGDITTKEALEYSHLESKETNKLLTDNITKTNKKADIRANFKPRAKYVELTGEFIRGDHPCNRKCREWEEPMICYYHFKLEWYHTMSKACFSCPYNETDCSRPDCIPADGMSRSLNVVNRKMPGPAIEVCQHDRVIVDVENDLMTEATTVHWHGQHQRGTPYMDGTPHVTQCPIPPGTTFRYQFNASHSGTHFWHSHSGMQSGDGAAGAFIVRKPITQDPHSPLYDYDRSEHIIIVTDWIHELSIAMFTDLLHSLGDSKPTTLLINGLGRFKYFNDSSKPMYMKAARFNVEQGYKYRFRVINNEFLDCPIELSVDGHNITVIASDGYDLEPITATSLVIYAGERYDFILDANNEIDNYWIRFRGLLD